MEDSSILAATFALRLFHLGHCMVNKSPHTIINHGQRLLAEVVGQIYQAGPEMINKVMANFTEPDFLIYLGSELAAVEAGNQFLDPADPEIVNAQRRAARDVEEYLNSVFRQEG